MKAEVGSVLGFLKDRKTISSKVWFWHSGFRLQGLSFGSLKSKI